MKKGFSLLELIFAIVVIGIISSFAIPKYLDTRDSALSSTIQRDLVTATTSIQSYYLVNRDIDDISKAITLNTKNWTLEAKKATFKEDSDCAVLLVDTDKKKISITIDKDAGNVCKKLDETGVKTIDIDLI